MIVNVSIFGSNGTAINNENRNQMIDFYYMYINNIYYKVSIMMSFKTYKRYRSELADMFGTDFEHILTLVENSKMKPGHIKILVTNMKIGERIYKTLELEVFRRYTKYNLDPLKTEIMMHNPSFLITNLATWEQITNEDYENVEKFASGSSAYYHAYYKVPVAICEMIPANVVKVII